MTDVLLLDSLAEFYARCWWRPELHDYLAHHQIDLGRVLPHVGAIGMMDVIEKPGDRFDFYGSGDLITCLVFEALDDDEQAFDLVALPIGEPEKPMTAFGRVGFVNPGIVLWPGSYTMGKAMPVHLHALDWLKSRCSGTAIIHQVVAAREMLDVPGELEARDWAHARQLKHIAESVVDLGRIVTPEKLQVAA